MSRSKAAHKRERARRHARQIAEGTRTPREPMERRIAKTEPAKRLAYRRRVRLSEVDREIVRAVIREVEKIEKYHATP